MKELVANQEASVVPVQSITPAMIDQARRSFDRFFSSISELLADDDDLLFCIHFLAEKDGRIEQRTAIKQSREEAMKIIEKLKRKRMLVGVTAQPVKKAVVKAAFVLGVSEQKLEITHNLEDILKKGSGLLVAQATITVVDRWGRMATDIGISSKYIKNLLSKDAGRIVHATIAKAITSARKRAIIALTPFRFSLTDTFIEEDTETEGVVESEEGEIPEEETIEEEVIKAVEETTSEEKEEEVGKTETKKERTRKMKPEADQKTGSKSDENRKKAKELLASEKNPSILAVRLRRKIPKEKEEEFQKALKEFKARIGIEVDAPLRVKNLSEEATEEFIALLLQFAGE